MYDSGENRNQTYEYPSWGHQPQVCGCFVYAKPTDFGKAFVSAWYENIRTDWLEKAEGGLGKNDQYALNDMIRGVLNGWDYQLRDAFKVKFGLLTPQLVAPGCMVERYGALGKTDKQAVL